MRHCFLRAERAISKAGVPFEVPDGEDRATRLGSVPEVVYLNLHEGPSATAAADWALPALCAEGLRLGRVLAELAPDEPEVRGLAALVEIQSSRMQARRSPEGEPVLLLEQDRRTWDRLLIEGDLAAFYRVRARLSLAVQRAQRSAGEARPVRRGDGRVPTGGVAHPEQERAPTPPAAGRRARARVGRPPEPDPGRRIVGARRLTCVCRPANGVRLTRAELGSPRQVLWVESSKVRHRGFEELDDWSGDPVWITTTFQSLCESEQLPSQEALVGSDIPTFRNVASWEPNIENRSTTAPDPAIRQRHDETRSVLVGEAPNTSEHVGLTVEAIFIDEVTDISASFSHVTDGGGARWHPGPRI